MTEPQSPPPLYVAGYDVGAEPEDALPGVRALAEVHRRHGAPATFFLTARVLEIAGREFRPLLDDTLFDVQPYVDWNAEQAPPEDVRREIELSRRLIGETFGREVAGLSTPARVGGFLGDPKLLGALWESGIRFLRSDGRGPDGTVPAPFTQPYWYGQDGYGALLELPLQYWPDDVLKGYAPGRVMWPPALPWGVPPAPPETPEEEFAIWRLGADYVLQMGLRVYQPSLRPWSVHRLSAEARHVDLLLGYMREQGVEIVSCREVYSRAHLGAESFPSGKAAPAPADRWRWPRTSLPSDANHDARAPLHPIVGHAELLALGAYGPLNERQQRAADEIMRCADRLAYVLEELTVAEKLAARRIRAEPEVISVAAVAREVCAQAADLSEGRARVEVVIEPGAQAVLADEARLLEITDALLRNALGFHPAEASLRLTARRVGARLLIELADDGPGLPPGLEAEAFRPLVRRGEPRPPLPSGLGLGLTIAEGLARVLDGAVRLVRSDGSGAAFVIDLPAAEPPDEP